MNGSLGGGTINALFTFGPKGWFRSWLAQLQTSEEIFCIFSVCCHPRSEAVQYDFPGVLD
jgi:hypothetical protein